MSTPADLMSVLRARFAQALAAAFGPDHAAADPQLRWSDGKFGDVQCNAAMSLAKPLGLKSRDVAAKLVEALVAGRLLDDLCQPLAPAAIAGPGFINLRLLNPAVDAQLARLGADDRLGIAPADRPDTVVVDYCSPNLAKEMHIGHMRSTIIGDSIARVLEFVGHRVIRQNHVGDWGTQFGMLLEQLLGDATAAEPPPSIHIGDLNALYQQASARYNSDPAFAERARKRVVALQSGDPVTLKWWRLLIGESVRHMTEITDRLGTSLTVEHVRGESFYNDLLPKVVSDLEHGGHLQISDGAGVVFTPGFFTQDGAPLPVIVRKADGGYLYATTDLAAARHRIEQVRANRLVYVVDARQAQHLAMVFATLRHVGWAPDTVHIEHVPFGMILGEDRTPFKTRSGGTVRLADVLDEAEQRADAIIRDKNPELPEDLRRAAARAVGIGAIKYADLSNERVKDYLFKWERMLSFDGNTAPYLQYAYARICSIFRKAAEGGSAADGPIAVVEPAERALALWLLQFADQVQAVAAKLEPHRLCNYLYDLSTRFSAFYESCPVLKAADPATRASRLGLCRLTARTLKLGLGLLGIQVMDQM